MSEIMVQKLNYVEGESEAYVETVARTGKPLASFNIVFDDEPDNWETMKVFEKSMREKAKDYGIKCYVRNFKQKYRDTKSGSISTESGIDFCYYKNDEILREYLLIMGKERRTKRDHVKLGKIFGYTDEAIGNFIKRISK